jgi:acetyl esterase/lipase
MDVYAGPGDARPVLLWHGRGPDERQVLRPLAQLAAGMGLVVFVPDWRPDAGDGGRAELLASVEFARSAAAEFTRSGQELVLAGWSRGGKAAAGLGLAPEEVGGRRPSAVVCLASGFTRPDPITRTSPLDLAKGAAQAPPFFLVHG